MTVRDTRMDIGNGIPNHPVHARRTSAGVGQTRGVRGFSSLAQIGAVEYSNKKLAVFAGAGLRLGRSASSPTSSSRPLAALPSWPSRR